MEQTNKRASNLDEENGDINECKGRWDGGARLFGRMDLNNSILLFGFLERRVNTRGKKYHLQELTVETGLIRGSQGVQCLLYSLDESSTALHALCIPKIAVGVSRANTLGPRLFKPVLPIPNCGLHLHRSTQEACVMGRVRLGAFNVNLCIVGPVFTTKQVIVPIKRGRDSDGHLIMVNTLLYLALGSVNLAESTMRFADQVFSIFPCEEIDCAECGFFCSVELFVRA